MIRLKHDIVEKRQEISFQLAGNQQMLLMPVGDVHCMSKGWPKQKFVDHLKWGVDRGATFLGMGEYIDFSSWSQREKLATLRETTLDQISDMVKDRVQEIGELIAFTRGHWIGLLEGDHFHQFSDGTTSDQMLAALLECHFLGTSTHIRLHSNGVDSSADCIIYAHHGIGTARMAGGHLHRVEDLLKFVHADIYLMGHTHSKVSDAGDRQEVTPDGIHHHRTILIARTGGFLAGYLSSEPHPVHANTFLTPEEHGPRTSPAALSRGSYVEKRAYRPSAMGGLCIGIGYERIQGSRYHRPTIHHSV